MDPTHRKIELQSPADLHFITHQIRTAARAKLDLHLPPIQSPDTSATGGKNGEAQEQPPDELRRKVEELVDLFVDDVLRGMRTNLSINGIPIVPDARSSDRDGSTSVPEIAEEAAVVEKEEFEDFDAKLQRQVADAILKRDRLVGGISAHRRGTAASAAEKYREGFLASARIYEAQAEGLHNAVSGAEGAQEGLVDVETIKRREEVERNWEKAVLGLERLGKGLPETRARLERCGDVVGYLEGRA